MALQLQYTVSPSTKLLSEVFFFFSIHLAALTVKMIFIVYLNGTLWDFECIIVIIDFNYVSKITHICYVSNVWKSMCVNIRDSMIFRSSGIIQGRFQWEWFPVTNIKMLSEYCNSRNFSVIIKTKTRVLHCQQCCGQVNNKNQWNRKTAFPLQL